MYYYVYIMYIILCIVTNTDFIPLFNNWNKESASILFNCTAQSLAFSSCYKEARALTKELIT